MNNKYILGGIIVLAGVVLIWSMTRTSPSTTRLNESNVAPTEMEEEDELEEKTEEREREEKMEKDDEKGKAINPMAKGKTFTLDGKPFAFSLKEIRVKEGDVVTITLTNSGGLHDWVVDEFNARTKQIKQGETDTIEFVADKAGTYEYYCSVANHRQLGMVGKLIVED